MDASGVHMLGTKSGARWCALVIAGAVPVLALAGAVLLAGADHAAQLAFATTASLAFIAVCAAAARLGGHRERQLAVLLEATRRLGRGDFSHVPGPLLGESADEGLGAVGQAYLAATARLQRRFRKQQAMLEMDRWLLTVGFPEEMLRGVLPLVTDILQCRSVSVVLLESAVAGSARSYDHLAESPSMCPAPRAISIDAECLRRASDQYDGLDMNAVGVDVEEYLAPLAASGAQAFRVAPLEFDRQVHGFLCVGYRVDAHGHEDADIGLSDIAERLSLALAAARQERVLAPPLAEPPPQGAPTATGLHRALQREEFTLVYQPIINAHSRHVTAVEALVRWPNGTDGSHRTAAEFVPVAEESGLIVDLGDWVLRTSCSQFETWRRGGLALEYISVNVSARQLRHAGLLATVLACLQRSNMQPAQLQLEITEAMLHEGPGAVATLRELAQRGVRLALDDFGDGNSRLSAVRDLPVTALKIDRACVAGIDQNEQVRDLVRAVVGMGAATGKLVIAEGVESPGQLAFLEAVGCDAMQGHLFALPLSAAEIADFAGSLPERTSLVA